MAVYITVATDAFSDVGRETQTYENVRRPLRGIEIKEDTYAVIRVIKATGEEIPIFDSSSADSEDGVGYSTRYSNFILQQVSEQRVEKQQIVETFGEDYIFFFGERPRIMTFAGVLLNTKDFNWKNEFLENYERHLRGTRLVEQNARLYLYFDDLVVEGYILQSSVNYASDSPYHVQFQFQMYVCQYADLSRPGITNWRNADMTFTEEEVGASPIPEGGIAPDTPEGAAATAAAASRNSPGSAGLNANLAQMRRFALDASVTIQRTVQQYRDTFFNPPDPLTNPRGIWSRANTLANQAQFSAPPVGVPYYENFDEYVVREPSPLLVDDAETARVQEQLRLNSPEALEEKAQQVLKKFGVDATGRSVSAMLLGAGAFAARRTFGAFGYRQAGGSLSPEAVAQAQNVANLGL
jgi:hypothetical protein